MNEKKRLIKTSKRHYGDESADLNPKIKFIRTKKNGFLFLKKKIAQVFRVISCNMVESNSLSLIEF